MGQGDKRVKFTLSSQNSLTLYFPEQGACYLIPDAQGKSCAIPSSFRNNFRCKIAFAPVLSPVDHNERLYQPEAARRALLSYQASRNFRNIWYHFPEKFEKFKELVESSWPGMSVGLPEVENIDGNAYLFMYCPEHRKPREIFWSGFGFQIWCQMLTHIVQSDGVSIFLIDEPDVYLHSDLQRQLVSILKELGPDIVLATHSTEIISECDSDEIVLISKSRIRSRRLRSPSDLGPIFTLLGSSTNPILTQLAKTRRVIFVEGNDFRLIAQFSRKIGQKRVASRSDFAVVQTDGFNPEKVKSLKYGMEHPLGRKILSGAILDRDYRSQRECEEISKSLGLICDFAIIHNRKEIENYVLVPEAIDRLISAKIREREQRGGKAVEFRPVTREILLRFADLKKSYLMSQFSERQKAFFRSEGERGHEAMLLQDAIEAFEQRWCVPDDRLGMIPGKEALSFLNSEIQDVFKVTVTPAAIVDAMHVDEIPIEMKSLVALVAHFATKSPPN